MLEVMIIFLVAIATIATTYIASLLGVAITGCFILFNYLPEWTWSLVLFILILSVMRSFRYSPE